MNKDFFRREEQKYVLSNNQYNKLLKLISNKLEKDTYFNETIGNLYFDTDDYYLICKSIEKPAYKEKVRLRCYNTPQLSDEVYLEIKKKYKKIVTKRRVSLILKDFYDYLETGKIPSNCNQQIMRELDYCIKYYHLKPKIYLAYDRLAYVSRDDKSLRITFDHNIRYRDDNLRLELGSGGIINNNKIYIMEIKSLNPLPPWLIKAFNELKIYPSSYSKYGEIYKRKKELKYV